VRVCGLVLHGCSGVLRNCSAELFGNPCAAAVSWLLSCHPIVVSSNADHGFGGRVVRYSTQLKLLIGIRYLQWAWVFSGHYHSATHGLICRLTAPSSRRLFRLALACDGTRVADVGRPGMVDVGGEPGFLGVRYAYCRPTFFWISSNPNLDRQ
jgi:hypothetical protein